MSRTQITWLTIAGLLLLGGGTAAFFFLHLNCGGKQSMDACEQAWFCAAKTYHGSPDYSGPAWSCESTLLP
ncbi:MAG: hypothetical protein KIT72_02570 [Polyangiaceae bacterium]|nr:hypothetical protein [Polyangiaceae bacterium]